MKDIKPQRTTQGGIKIEFMLNRVRYQFSPVLGGRFDNNKDYGLAVAICRQIAQDIHGNIFDETLERYKPQTPEKAQVLREAENYDLYQLWNAYAEAKKNHVSQSTFEIGYERVRRYLETLQSCKMLDANKIKLEIVNHKTPSSTKFLLGQLNACCKWGIEVQLINKNPFDGWQKLLNKKTAKSSQEINPFTLEERDAIIDAFAQHKTYKHYRYFVAFLFHSGCRPSEAIALTWDDVKNNQIIFNKTFVSGNISQRLKTQDSRQIRQNNNVKTIIENQSAYLKSQYAGDKNLVFPSARDLGYIDWDYFAISAWKKVLKSIENLEYKNPYQMRHTFITLALKNGISPQDIARHCGNSADVIFRHYAGTSRSFVMPDF
jgi:integrase